jgi:nitrite reductase/ring-hydroxylating ferredoxin subunit
VSRRRGRLEAFVEALLKDRRPPRFPAEEDEARQMLTAAALRAGRPGADAPRPEFVESLQRRLRSEMQAGEAGSAPRVSRRRLLGGAATAAAAAVGAGIGIDRLMQHGDSTPATAGGELVPHTGKWVDVAAADAIPVGRPMRASAGAIEVFVVNHGDRMQAVSAMCTHMPCTLKLNSGAQQLDCPCHGAWFGLDGTPVAGQPYPYQLPPLPTVRTRVVDGRVQVFST